MTTPALPPDPDPLSGELAVVVLGRAIIDGLDESARASVTALEAAAAALELRVVISPARHRNLRRSHRRVPAADLAALVAAAPLDIPTLAERAYRGPGDPWTPSDRSWAEQKTRHVIYRLARLGHVIRGHGPGGEDLVGPPGWAP